MILQDEPVEIAATKVWNKTQDPSWILASSLDSTSPASRNYLTRDWFFTEIYDCQAEAGWDPRWLQVVAAISQSVRRPVWRPDFIKDRFAWHTCYQLLHRHEPTIQDMIAYGVSMGSFKEPPTEAALMFGRAMLGFRHIHDTAAPEVVDRPVSAMNDFCLYGVVNCFAVSAAIMISEPERTAEYWNLDLADIPTAPQLLKRALLLLEARGAFDMMESSMWPLRSIDIRLMLSNHLHYEKQGLPVPREIHLYQRGSADQCLPGQPVPATCNWPLPHWLLMTAWRPLPRDSQPVARLNLLREELTVAAFGLHGSLKMEPMSALKAACPEVLFHVRLLGTDCRVGETARLYGCKLLCSLQDRCHVRAGRKNEAIRLESRSGEDFSDALGAAMAYVLEMSKADPIAFQKAVRDFQAVAFASIDLKNLDLFICVDGIYCPLFRPILAGVPFLLYLSHPLLNAAGDYEVLRNQLSAFRLELEQRWAMAAVAFPHTAGHCYYATGVRLPFIRSEAMYLDHVQYRPDLDKKILFARTSFWGTFTGTHFKAILNRLMWNNHLHTEVSCTFLSNHDFLEYEEMATFHAAVLVPIVNYVMSFDEFYSIGIPLFLPNREWLTKLFMYSAYTTFATTVFNPVVRTIAVENQSLGMDMALHVEGTSLEHEPDDFRVYYFWHSLGPFGMYPYVMTFDSVPDCLDQILKLDRNSAQALHAGMKSYVRRSRIHTLGWYRKTLQTLLG